MRNHHSLRSNCPINFSLEMAGDSWSLLIIRDIVYFGKKTFGEFLNSNEGIARNILASRLARLLDNGIISKKPHPTDGRREIYELTEQGIDLIPILLDLAEWGAVHYPDSDAPADWIELVRTDRERIIKLIQNTIRSGGSVFVGQGSVIDQLE